MNQKIKSQKNWYIGKQYKVIREKDSFNDVDVRSQIHPKNYLNLISIDQNHTHSHINQINNIFESEASEKQPDGFMESARLYDVVGFKIVKNYNPKKQKKKLLYKRTDSASSKISKMSSAQSSSIEKGKNQKNYLLQQANKITKLVRENEAIYKKRNKNNKFCNSQQVLQNFKRVWNKNEKIMNAKLGRNENSSLASLSSAFRQKIQKLQINALNEKNNNILPPDWLKTLREEVKIQNVYSKKFVEKIYKIVDCQRKQRLKYWGNNSKNQLGLKGQNKLRKQINCINEKRQTKISLKFDKI